MDRPNWNYDNSGGEVALAMPSVDTVTDMVVRGEAPTPEIQRAFAQHNGEPVRHDWNHAPVAVKSKGLSVCLIGATSHAMKLADTSLSRKASTERTGKRKAALHRSCKRSAAKRRPCCR